MAVQIVVAEAALRHVEAVEAVEAIVLVLVKPVVLAVADVLDVVLAAQLDAVLDALDAPGVHLPVLLLVQVDAKVVLDVMLRAMPDVVVLANLRVIQLVMQHVILRAQRNALVLQLRRKKINIL
jgi:hypothetical protein